MNADKPKDIPFMPRESPTLRAIENAQREVIQSTTHMFTPGQHVKFTVNMRRFVQYEIPHGNLTNHPGCHGLFYYYLLARKAYEEFVKPFELEGHLDQVHDFRQLFTTTAMLYGVAPEVMAKFWSNVDTQCLKLGLPLLPPEERFRFDHIPEIKTDA